jgi:hypothetical protein
MVDLMTDDCVDLRSFVVSAICISKMMTQFENPDVDPVERHKKQEPKVLYKELINFHNDGTKQNAMSEYAIIVDWTSISHVTHE